MSKFENEQKVPLFGKYKDPFGERRGSGKTRPSEPVPAVDADFKREFATDKLYFSWLGHSSAFLHMQGMNILIDPVFSMFTSPVPFVGPKRFPGKVAAAEDFPVIDMVLITHSHYDHMDRKTIRSLDSQVKHYVVPKGVGKLLHRFGVRYGKIRELNWYDSVGLNGLGIALVPSQHDSGRGPWDMNRTLWGGFILKNKNHTVFDSGDGGYAGHFREIQKRYGDIDLAIMECGQYNEKWHAIHMFPEESVQASLDLHAKMTVPVHWGAYVLSDHAWDDPPKRFCRRADELGLTCQVMKIHEWLVL